MVFSSHAAVRHGPSLVPLLNLVEQDRPLVCRRGGVDVLGVAGDGDAGVLRAGNLDGGVLGQLGDHRVRVGVGPAVQVLHQLRDATGGWLPPRRVRSPSPSDHRSLALGYALLLRLSTRTAPAGSGR